MKFQWDRPFARPSRMVCRHVIIFLLLVSLLILIFSLVHSSFHINHGKVSSPRIGVPDHLKVNLSLYYEALCPFCMDFIENDLPQLFKTDLVSIVNLRLVPWGNAAIVNNNITCQHGLAECYLNTIEACAIDAWPNVKLHFNYIHCIERTATYNADKENEKVWRSCCKELGLNPKPISDCYNNGLGRKLVLQHGNETDNLNPRIEYVPWVVVNDRPLYNEYMDFITHVCNAYKGNPKPRACNLHKTKMKV